VLLFCFKQILFNKTFPSLLKGIETEPIAKGNWKIKANEKVYS